MPSNIRQLDPETLHFFENVVAGRGKGLHVRRYIQAVQDITGHSLDHLTLLDLACGEAVYAIESALQGARVVAIDGRMERMGRAIEVANRLNLDNIRFEQGDIREVTVASHGQFDVIFAIGIAYHLDNPSIFSFLENIYGMARKLALIDTNVSRNPDSETTYHGKEYQGIMVREHNDVDSDDEKKQRLLASLDNTFSFVLSKDSLIRFLGDTGFTSVLECHLPLDPYRHSDRITLLALKGSPAEISSYPWVNDKSAPQMLEAVLKSRPTFHRTSAETAGGKSRWLKRLFRRFGYDLRRIPSSNCD